MPTKKLTPREALAMADCGDDEPRWRARTIQLRNLWLDEARKIEVRMLRLGFHVVPLPEKKGRERG